MRTQPLDHRFVLAGIENPRVMKSPLVPEGFVGSREENRPFRFSLPACFLRLLRCSCSSRTFAVIEAVDAFLIPTSLDP